MEGCPVVADLLPLTQGLRQVACQHRAHHGKMSRWGMEQTIGCPVVAEPLPLPQSLYPRTLSGVSSSWTTNSKTRRTSPLQRSSTESPVPSVPLLTSVSPVPASQPSTAWQ